MWCQKVIHVHHDHRKMFITLIWNDQQPFYLHNFHIIILPVLFFLCMPKNMTIIDYYFMFRYSSLVPQNPNIPQKPFMYSFMSKLVLSIFSSSSHLHFHPTHPSIYPLVIISSATFSFSTYPLHLPFVPSPLSLHLLPLLSLS